MKNLGKKLLAMLLCVVMCVSFLPVNALAEGTIEAADASGGTVDEAAETTGTIMAAPVEEQQTGERKTDPEGDVIVAVEGETITVVPTVETGDENLLDAYAAQRLYEPLRGEQFRGQKNNGDKLKDHERIAYDLLKQYIEEVAAGERTSTVFTFSFEELGFQTTWTAEELGVSSIYFIKEDGKAAFTEEAKTAIKAKLGFDKTNMESIITALLLDSPYELYWFDKTAQTKDKLSYSGSFSDSSVTLSGSHEFSFPVAEYYQDGDEYTVKDAYGTVIKTAVTNAEAVVEEYSGFDSDYQKLVAYKDEICAMASYNHEAAAGSAAGTEPYGNPWQIIWVFDGDPDTEVVCEGYAKAFQYLCDLTDFETDSITAYCVSGTMNGGTGAGPHMWNIVTMDSGKNYLVDVTNCDEETVGAPDKLFLAGYSSGSVDGGYVISTDRSSITYTYDEETQSIYTNDELTISRNNYLVVPIDEDHFPDWIFCDYVDSNFDLYDDDWLSEAEIMAADIIDIEIEDPYGVISIESLQGIEYLTELEELDVFNCPELTELDLSDNTKLGYINLLNTSLTALNLSSLPLISFVCAISKLQTLTLGNQPNLEQMCCFAVENGFTELDISGCPYIIDAYLNGKGVEDNGSITYEGPLPLGGVLCVDTDVTIVGTDIEYTGPTWNWTGFSKATATFECSNYSLLDKTIDAVITFSETTPATCESAGETIYTATVTFDGETYTDVKEEILPALGHDYEVTDWTWTGTTAATVSLTCRNNAEHVGTADAEITTETIPATCEEDGMTIYIATAVFGGRTWTNTKDGEVIPATGHTPVTDAAVAPTCTETGLTEGSHCSVCGTVIVEQETVAALGHDYGIPEWTWTKTNDGYTAVATFTCKNNNDHVEMVEATVTSEASSVVTTYTATVTFNDETYTDEKVVRTFSDITRNTLNLAGKLYINTYIKLSDEIKADPDAYVLVTFKGKTTTTTKHYVSEFETEYSYGVKVEQQIYAAMLRDEMIVQVFNGADELQPLTYMGTEDVTDGYVYRAIEYLEEQEGASDTKRAELARAVKLYGTAVQVFFKYHPDLVSDADLAELQTAAGAITIPADYDEVTSGSLPEGISLGDKSVEIMDDHALRQYFLFNDGDLGRYTFTVNGNPASAVKKTSGTYYIAAREIASGELSEEQTYTISDGTNTYTIRASALSYAYGLQNSSDANRANVAKLMYRYSQAADAFFG